MSNPDPKHDPENTNFEYDEAGVRITPPSTFNTIVRETNDVKLTITIPQSLYENLKICIEDKNKRIRKASKNTGVNMKRITLEKLTLDVLLEWVDYHIEYLDNNTLSSEESNED